MDQETLRRYKEESARFGHEHYAINFPKESGYGFPYECARGCSEDSRFDVMYRAGVTVAADGRREGADDFADGSPGPDYNLIGVFCTECGSEAVNSE